MLLSGLKTLTTNNLRTGFAVQQMRAFGPYTLVSELKLLIEHLLLSGLKTLTTITVMPDSGTDRTASERAEEVREGLKLLADYL